MSSLPPHLRATLDILRARTTNDGECQMSLSELAQVRGISQRTLRRHVRQLENLGYLTIHRRPGQPSSYQLTASGQGFGRIADRLRRLLPKTEGLEDMPAPPRLRSPAQLAPSAAVSSSRGDVLSDVLSGVLSLSKGPLPSLSRGSSKGLSKGRIEGTVGRQDILTALQENTVKRQHTLLVGPLGIGKSHILRHFATQIEQRSTGDRGARGQGDSATEGRPHPVTPSPPHLVYLDHVSPIKPALLTLAQRLHADGNLAVEGIEANYMEWEDVRKKIAPLRVIQLADLVIKCLAPSAERTEGMADRNYVLLMDHLERVTPTMLPHLDALMDVAVVIAATDELKPSAQRLWWAFERVEVPPLPRDQARELLWQVADRDRVANPQLFETRVLQQAGGNPLAIVTMAGKAAPQGSDRGDHTATLSAQEIRGLRHGAGVRYISLTPALMLIGALIVAARFVALGLNDRDLYVLAGLGYASFFFMRYFIYRID